MYLIPLSGSQKPFSALSEGGKGADALEEVILVWFSWVESPTISAT